MVKQTYRFSRIAQAFCLVTTGMLCWAEWFVTFRIPSENTEYFWVIFGWVLVVGLCWTTVLSFIERITVDEEGVRFHNLFFHPRQFRWADIKEVRSDISTTGGESISIRVYNVVSRHHRYRLQLGLWIAHYKDLLRDLLTYAPDDAQTDVNVYHAIRRRGETVEDAYRAVAQERQARQSMGK